LQPQQQQQQQQQQRNPLGCRCRIVIVVRARYSKLLRMLVGEAEEQQLSSERWARLRWGDEDQSRKTACREERAKEPLQPRCS